MSERRSGQRAEQATLTTPSGHPATVVHISAEYVPFARTGGLAEAAANLSRFQSKFGIRTMAFLPLYRSARATAGDLVPVGDPFEVPLGARRERVRILTQANPAPNARVYFVEHDGFYDRPSLYGDTHGDYRDNHLRFGLFALASVMAIPMVASGPIILHSHDWHAALALTYVRTRFASDPRYAQVRTVLSVHNAGYQGHLPASAMDDLGLPWSLFNYHQLEWYGKLNLLKAGLAFADAVVTVSPNHALELRTPDGGFGLHNTFASLEDRFTGIINGIDHDTWNPETDSHIAQSFSPTDARGKIACKRALQERFGLKVDARVPVFGMAARLVTQKGLDIVVGTYDLFRLDAQFVFIGAGEARFEESLAAIARMMTGKVAVNTKFTDELEHLVMAGSDFLLMPCQYEPCGLTQMRAQRYGVAPIVRRVGGLADTVEDGVTGFVFDPYEAAPLVGAALRGMDCYYNPFEWARMIRTAMARDFSWPRSVEKYVDLYRRVLEMDG